MKKKFIILFLSIACALCLVFAFAGCTDENGESLWGGTNTQQGETGGSDNTDDSGNTGDTGSSDSGSDNTGGGHVHNYGNLIPEKSATCTEEGLQAHYYCSGCQKYFDGEKSEKTLAELKISVDPNAHKWGEWTETEPTCEKQGGELRVCKLNNSHTELKNPIPALGHILEENQLVCKTCNEQLAASLKFILTYSDDTYILDTYILTSGTPTSDGKIMIPKTYNGLPVTSIGVNAFKDCTSLISVTIPDSVTSIVDQAFHCCENLTSVTIGNGLTSIDRRAFVGCRSLTSITIPDSVTSIGISAFDGCTSLESVTIGNGVTSIGERAFACCKLKSVAIPDSVTSIDKDAFYYCTSLESVYINDIAAWCNIDFGGITANPLYYVHNLYLNNQLVTELTAEMLQGVTEIKARAFTGCTKLTSVTIPDNVTSIGERAFDGCYKLVEVINLSDLPIEKGKDTYGGIAKYALNVINSTEQSKIKYLQDYIFYEDGDTVYLLYYKGNSTELQLPEKFVEKTYGIYNYVFYNNDKITKVTIPDSVTSIGGYAFYGCTAEIKWGDNPTIKEIGEYAFSNYKGTSITIPDSVTSIGESAFYNCTSLKSVTIPDSVTSIGEDAFYKCTSLENITVTDGNTAYSSQDGILYNKNKTEIIIVPKAIKGSVTIPNGVTSIGSSAFSDCKSLESVTIPDSVTSIGSSAFSGCTSLTSITIPNSVTSIGGYAFYGCTAEIKWGDNPTIKEIGEYAFRGYKGTSITLPNSVTSIGSSAFWNCTNLKGVYITDIAAWCNIDFGNSSNNNPLSYAHNLYLNNQLITELTAEMLQGVTTIKDYAFYGCTSLESVTIPDSVTSIGEDAFRWCESLESVTIPNGVTSIGGGAFYGCTNLTSVIFNNPDGWYRTKDSSATGGTDIPSEDLQNTETAATYLRSTYSGYEWKRKTA